MRQVAASRACVSLLAVLGCGLLTATPAGAAEVEVKNDSVPGVGPATALPTFIPGEQPAAWLTSPVAGDIVAVRVDWESIIPTGGSTVEMAIHVYAGGAFPAPGSLLASVSTPTLIEGMINEYRFTDVAMTVPLQVPVISGQVFVVALEFLNDNSSGGPFLPSVTYDADSCQAGKNAVFVIPGGWSDACPLGVPGDFVIRAVVAENIPVPGLGAGGVAALATLLAGSGWLARRARPIAA